MINRCCNKSIDFLIDNGSLNSEDKELYMYSMRVLICGLINAVTAIAIGIAMGMLKQSVCLFVTFFIIRKFSGGMHADKYKNCFFSSTIINAVALGIIYIFESIGNVVVFRAILIISVISIVILSPLGNQNKPLTVTEQRVYKGVSIAVSLVISVASLISITKNAIIGYSFGFGLILSSVLLIIGFVYRNKKCISE